MIGFFPYVTLLIEDCEFKNLSWSIRGSEEGRCSHFFVVGRTRVLEATTWHTFRLCPENQDL